MRPWEGEETVREEKKRKTKGDDVKGKIEREWNSVSKKTKL